MANLAPLAPITTAAQALSNLILVSPQSTVGYQPQVKSGATNNLTSLQPAPSIVFNYEGEQTALIESDITDHYIEDNTAIQDQIALKPEIITTHGFIGELNDVAPSLLAPLQVLANKLTIIDAYTPVLSTTALLAYNNAFQAYQIASNAANAAISAWSTVNSQGSGENVISSGGLGTQFNPLTGLVNGNQTKQQIVFQQFYGYWKNRTLFTIQTPWAVFQNMAILSLRAIQEAETRVITDFEVSFKMIRIASTAVVTNTLPTSKQSRRFNQSQPVINQGTSTPAPSISLESALGQ